MLNQYLTQCGGNVILADAFTKADSIINDDKYSSALCSISGGSDSDVMLDIIHKVDKDRKVKYVWFDTGLEYQATKDHLTYLENQYNIEIHRERAVKPIPLCAKEFGQPFLSKYVSNMIMRLQECNFQWENEPFDVLYAKYPNCKSAILWWCNAQKGAHVDKYGYSMFNINYHRLLKPFILQNPPTFKISDKCCEFAKKKVSYNYMKKNKVKLLITGVRKSEGGVRSGAYDSCFDVKNSHHNYDRYRPIFWFKQVDKCAYNEIFNIRNSDCYTKYGFARTGCVGCPFNRWLHDEIDIISQYEPKLYVAIQNVFKDSYAYTKQYKEFVAKTKRQEKGIMVLF